MLYRFGVSNYRSFKDYQELSLVASSLKDCPDYLLSGGENKERALPVVAIYGANASGKSNLLRAIDFLHSSVIRSQVVGSADGGVPDQPFLLDPACAGEPSRFDCDFLVDSVRYHYGFCCNKERFLEEWLYAYPSGFRQVWYHRKHGENPPFYFGKNLRGKNRTIESLTRDNSLFLSAAAQNNHEQLLPIYRFFSSDYRFLRLKDADVIVRTTDYLDKNEPIRKAIVDFLRLADTGVIDIAIERMALTDRARLLSSDIDALFRRHLPTEVAQQFTDLIEVPKRIRLAHLDDQAVPVFFELEDESQGTRTLLGLLASVFGALETGGILFIDELDTSIHTLLSNRILGLFVSPQKNARGAQIVFTTHDTNLLCGRSLRRDGIWFTEKNNEGATVVYPLTDIKTRNTDNLEKGYLQGRFGGVPFLGGLDELFGEGETRR